MDFNIGRMKVEAMAKAFGLEIEKGRVGVYEDNAENRRLNRVGQPYGHKKEEEAPKAKQPAAQEQQGAGDIGKQAAAASDGALKRAAADPKAAPEVKQAAQAEMKKRGGAAAEDSKKDSMKSGISINDMSDEEIANMSYASFNKKFSQEINSFFKKLDDSSIDKIGYLPGSKTPSTFSEVEGSDGTITFEFSKRNGRWCWSIVFERSTVDEDGYDAGSGGKALLFDNNKTYSTPEESIKAAQDKVRAVKNGEKIEFEEF